MITIEWRVSEPAVSPGSDTKRTRMGEDMLKALSPRLSYANVMATAAMFVALGGGAYALSGTPDRSGVFHGCVSKSTRVLRAVKSANSCQKARTIRRNGHRVHLSGEFAIAWNQKGQPGANGKDGMNGTKGTHGTNGATNLTVRSATGNAAGPMAESTAQSSCNAGEHQTGGGTSVIRTGNGVSTLELSGPNGPNWLARTINTGGVGSTVTLIANSICASP